MATVEWDIPFELVSPLGTWTWNQASGAGARFLLDHGGCQAGADLRVSVDHVPQASGDIVHRHLRTGYAMKFQMEFWKDDLIAFRADKRSMWETLSKHLLAIVDPSVADLFGGNCRVLWTPSGEAQRLLDRIQLLEPPLPADDEDTGLLTVTFAVHSPFPYAIDAAQTVTNIADTGSALLTNAGTSPFYPVFKVYGFTSFFRLWNSDTDEQIIYNASLPGAVDIAGGHYAEIDTFRNTVYLDGDGANLKAGIDLENSDFWQLQVGANNVHITGAGVDVLWQRAWA